MLIKVPSGSQLVVAIDTLVAGVHFPVTTGAGDLGYKAVAVNLSDLAAMGAMPVAMCISLTVAASDRSWLAQFERGVDHALQPFGVASAPATLAAGALAVTGQAFGVVPSGHGLLRSGARPGDRIYVTGTLGDAALALAEHYGRVELCGSARAHSWSRLNRPNARVRAGIQLRGIASAAIDVSDGLLSDLGHLTAASRVAASVRLEDLPLSATLRSTCRVSTDAWRQALTVGDDYELCFTVPPARAAELESRLPQFDCGVTAIGLVENGRGVRCLGAGGTEVDLGRGYQHFADEA